MCRVIWKLKDESEFTISRKEKGLWPCESKSGESPVDKETGRRPVGPGGLACHVAGEEHKGWPCWGGLPAARTRSPSCRSNDNVKPWGIVTNEAEGQGIGWGKFALCKDP